MSGSRDGRGRGNPWGRGRGNTHPQKAPSFNNLQTKQARSNQHRNNGAQEPVSSNAEDKFMKAKLQMKEAADKHKLSGYESSSEEEELESENILGKRLF